MSKGMLDYPGRGMHFYTILDHEFEGLDGYWHRVEVAEIPSDDKGNFTTEAFSYRGKRGYWMPCHCQQCAMEKTRLKAREKEIQNEKA